MYLLLASHFLFSFSRVFPAMARSLRLKIPCFPTWSFHHVASGTHEPMAGRKIGRQKKTVDDRRDYKISRKKLTVSITTTRELLATTRKLLRINECNLIKRKKVSSLDNNYFLFTFIIVRCGCFQLLSHFQQQTSTTKTIQIVPDAFPRPLDANHQNQIEHLKIKQNF